MPEVSNCAKCGKPIHGASAFSGDKLYHLGCYNTAMLGLPFIKTDLQKKMNEAFYADVLKLEDRIKDIEEALGRYFMVDADKAVEHLMSLLEKK